jgi:transposase InsO family protein
VVAGYGTVSFVSLVNGAPQQHELKDVLFVPTLNFNLVSVHKATRAGLPVTFTEKLGEITCNGRPVMQAEGKNGLYLISALPKSALATAAVTSALKAHRAHQRFAHLGYDNLIRMVQGGMVAGLDVSVSDLQAAKASVCEPCALGKAKRLPFPEGGPRRDAPAALVVMDLCGPISIPTNDGSKYVATFTDDYSGLSVVRLLKTKDAVVDVVKDVLTQLETQSKHKLRAIRTDRGLEYLNQRLDRWLADKGVVHETTAPYTPEQNGRAERLNRVLMERTRAMLVDSGLPARWWGEALMTANYLRNRSPAPNGKLTPWELFFGAKPDVSHFRVFGCKAYVTIPKPRRASKVEPVAIAGTFVGYEPHSKAFRILMADNTISISRDVRFDESQMGGRAAQAPVLTFLDDSDEDDSSDEDTPDPQPAVLGAGGVDEFHSPEGTPARQARASNSGGPSGGESGRANRSHSADPPLRRSSRVKNPNFDPNNPLGTCAGFAEVSEWIQAGADPDLFPYVSGFAAVSLEPQTLKEALDSDEAPEWQAAVDGEIKSLHENDTWEYMPTPPGVKPIPVRWIFKVKKHADGSIERYKARLVAKGYRQIEGVDFNEVYAPVSKHTTFRTLLALTARDDLELEHMDVKTAFLQGELEEVVYMDPPPGSDLDTKGMCCRLKKAIYGLRQAPRAWHTKLKTVLASMGFKASAADAALFWRGDGRQRIWLLVYVDDILVAGRNKSAIAEIKRALQKALDIKDLGPASLFLGMTITRDRAGRTVRLGQERLIEELLERFEMAKAHGRALPLDAGANLVPATDKELIDTCEKHYSALVGSLLYLSVCTRPDISQAVGVLSRYMARPGVSHWGAARGVLRYLRGTSSLGLKWHPCTGGDRVLGYTDSNYAGDMHTRRSTTGYVFVLHGAALCWSSRLQPTVALSTAEAEYMAACNAAKEGIWLTLLLKDLGISKAPMRLLIDNTAALAIAKNPIASNRSKHIDVQYHFVRERVESGEILVAHVPSEDNVADLLTKVLSAPLFKKGREAMGMK